MENYIAIVFVFVFVGGLLIAEVGAWVARPTYTREEQDEHIRTGKIPERFAKNKNSI